MKVYVLESGCYEEILIWGVFSTPEKAMATWHPARSVHADPRHTYTWNPAGGPWLFSADWGDFAQVTEYEVDEEA